MKAIAGCAAALVMAAPAAHAQEQGAAAVPAPVTALAGCWSGTGEVMGKPVTITLHAHAITLGALFVVEAESRAVADASDRYAAHLIFGGAERRPGEAAEPVSGFWADSFGAGFTATGRGEARADGFDITYRYPDAAFVNRWRQAGAELRWQIVARDEKGKEQPFASYVLRKTACAAR